MDEHITDTVSDQVVGSAPAEAPVALDGDESFVILENQGMNPREIWVLDSNGRGDAYASKFNSGPFQKWVISRASGPNIYKFRNLATSRFLDSDHRGNVYTLPHNDGPFQLWEWEGPFTVGTIMQLQNVATTGYLRMALVTPGSPSLLTEPYRPGVSDWRARTKG
jgi:hypothetical protein